MNNIKISAIITSGGNSTRFGSNKLLEKINDKTVIETTISKFLDLVDEIIIPSSEEIQSFLLKSDLFCEKIKFAHAGKTRQKSVYNGINKANNPKIILIHDGARPFIEKETIKKAIDLTFEKQAVLVGTMAIDTIKEVKDGVIIKTLDRKNIFQAQTPQCFDFQLIKKIHEHYKNEENFTDDSSMAEAYGVKVYILEGLKTNKKITTREDL